MKRAINLVGLGFAVLLLLGFGGVTRAQDQGSQQQPSAQSESQMNHKTMHHNRLDWLSKKLNLTDDQKAKIKPILDDESSSMKGVRDDTSLSQTERHAKMKDLHQATDSKINDILTPEQQQKFAQMQQQMKEHHKDKMANPQPAPDSAPQPQ
ncbi:MAG: hypothetical protein ACRD4S_17325 [Candidatus Acidiferrales bacterium]